MTETAKEAAKRIAAPMLDKGFMPEALHTYTDTEGKPLHWRIRVKHPETKEKRIRPMKFNGHGYELGEPKYPNGKPLYNLHGIASKPDAEVWIFEGEQKADAAIKRGLLATTSGGSTSAATTDWAILKARAVRIFPDCDDAGKTYAGEVATILLKLGCKVSCVDVDKLGLGKGDDLMQWLEAHPEATNTDIEALPVLTPSQPKTNAVNAEIRALVVADLHTFMVAEFPVREPILTPILLTQSLNMVHGWRGLGKTHVSLGIFYAVGTGGAFLNWKADKARKVLLIDGEMPAPSLQERLTAIIASSGIEPQVGYLNILTPDLQTGAMPDLAEPEGQDEVNAVIDRTGAELIIVDNLSCLVRGSGRENDAESWTLVSQWGLFQRQQGRSVLFIHHSGKDGKQRGTSKREDLLDVVVGLRRPPDYDPSQGACFEIHYEKARHLSGDDVTPIEAQLTTDKNGLSVWTWRKVSDSTYDRVVSLANDGLSQTEIATELEVNKSTVNKAWKKADAAGLLNNKQTAKGNNQYQKASKGL